MAEQKAKDENPDDNGNGEQYILTMIQPDAAGRSYNLAGVPGCEGLFGEGEERAAVVRFKRDVPQRVPKPVFEHLKDRTEKTVGGLVVPVFRVGEPDEQVAAGFPLPDQLQAVREKQAETEERLDNMDSSLDEILALLKGGAAKPAANVATKKRARTKQPKAAKADAT